MVLAVAVDDMYRLVCKRWLRLQGRCYEVEAYEEARPDVAFGPPLVGRALLLVIGRGARPPYYFVIGRCGAAAPHQTVHY